MIRIAPSIRRLCAIITLLLAGPHAGNAAEPKLSAYNADPGESTVSGISSGAFMAVQLATAFSATFKGVGVVAGGPFGCAQPSTWAPGLAIITALGPCMKGDPAPSLAPLITQANKLMQSRDIDPLGHLRQQKIYVFHGYNDKVVAETVTDATVAFYQHYLGPDFRGNVFYQTTYGAGHSQVTLDWGLPCAANSDYYIDKCGYDQAGVILRHMYGALNPRNTGPAAGKLLPFTQGAYTTLDPDIYSMGDTGYVYVPNACAAGEPCRVHIALHGCQQDADEIGDKYTRNAGYNQWADNNHMIVLYPQTKKIGPAGQDPLAWNPLLVNPNACWDWWGYHDFTNAYMTHDGQQMAAIHAMLLALTADFHAQPPAPAAAVTAPQGLEVTDSSDKAAALAWRAVPGAASYRVYRASEATGPFKLAGNVARPSFGDSGLMPGANYFWQVSAVAGTVESDRSSAVPGRTVATPPKCDAPGTCVVISH